MKTNPHTLGVMLEMIEQVVRRGAKRRLEDDELVDVLIGATVHHLDAQQVLAIDRSLARLREGSH